MEATTTSAAAGKKKAQEEDQLVELTPAQLQQVLGGQDASREQQQQLAKLLGISGAEAANLRAGQASLRMTPHQYEAFKEQAARFYAQNEENADQKTSKGGACGASGSPAPTVAPVKSTGSYVSETNAGTTQHTGKVGEGVVTLRTGVEANAKKDWFVIGYKGKDSQNAHWLQFVNREIIGVKDDGSSFVLTDSVTTTGGTYKLTQGGTDKTYGSPASENYNTDTADKSNPFYEAAGANNRTADSTTMYDLPSALKSVVDKAFAAGAKKVISRFHANTFLVQTDKVTYKVNLAVIWEFGSETDDPARQQKAGPAGAATSLPDPIRQRFHQQFPAFNFIQ